MTRYEYVNTVLEPRFKDEDELYHHGILGMKWGVRRYQNKDGSLTEAGKRKYGSIGINITKEQKKDAIIKNKELKNLRANVIDAYGWNVAAKAMMKRETKTHDDNINRWTKLKEKYPDAISDETLSEVNKTSKERYNIAKALANAYVDDYNSKKNEYETKAKEYVDLYGTKRITDVKHLKTTKNGEKYITGFDGIMERSMMLKTNTDGSYSLAAYAHIYY